MYGTDLVRFSELSDWVTAGSERRWNMMQSICCQYGRKGKKRMKMRPTLPVLSELLCVFKTFK